MTGFRLADVLHIKRNALKLASGKKREQTDNLFHQADCLEKVTIHASHSSKR